MELYAKLVDCLFLQKSSTADVWQGPKWASETNFLKTADWSWETVAMVSQVFFITNCLPQKLLEKYFGQLYEQQLNDRPASYYIDLTRGLLEPF